MSSYSKCAGEEHRKKEKRRKRNEEEEEESVVESEEVDQLLSSYRKNAPKKRSTASVCGQDGDSRTSTINGSGGGGRDEVVVCIEHHDQPDTPSIDHDTEKDTTPTGDNYARTESPYSSTSVLRDLLPHLTESNTGALSCSSPVSSCTHLSKTYTEPTSLSGLLRQMGNRLFWNYPGRTLIRHAKISPTASMHWKLDDCDNETGSPATLLTTTAVPLLADCLVEKTDDNDESSDSRASLPDSPTARHSSVQRQPRRPPVKTPLCKRCPHCRKTCPLRRVNASENIYNNNNNNNNSGNLISASVLSSVPNTCNCRICMAMESVESTLSSPSVDSDNVDSSSHLPASSRSNVEWSAFANAEFTCDDCPEGVLGGRHASVGAASLELGVFCGECNGTRSIGRRSQEACPKVTEISSSCEQRSREQGIQVNSSSMISIATTSSFGGPVCRICHSPGDKLQPLISPCRCLGTLKYVHASCLLHWLEISSRKLRRPPHCELCGYRYQRHKTMKLRRVQWPTCTRRDKMYHVLFMVSVLVMMACAAVTIVCFKTDRVPTRTSDAETNVLKKTTGGGAAAVGAGGSTQVELSGQEVVTLVCGILFFCAFFVAMYVQVKAQTTVYKLCVRFWSMNQEWHVDEYRRERDVEYWRQRREQQRQMQRRTSQMSSSSVQHERSVSLSHSSTANAIE